MFRKWWEVWPWLLGTSFSSFPIFFNLSGQWVPLNGLHMKATLRDSPTVFTDWNAFLPRFVFFLSETPLHHSSILLCQCLTILCLSSSPLSAPGCPKSCTEDTQQDLYIMLVCQRSRKKTEKKVYTEKEESEDIVCYTMRLLQANMHLLITWTAEELLEPK